MRLFDSRFVAVVVGLLLLGAGGCQSTPVGTLPAGPGVATHGNLKPWLASAKQTTRFGCLMECNVPSEQGSYDTWALATTDPAQSVEVDVRACPGAANDFWEKPVIISGKLIARNERHLPLLVAQRIVPADDDGNELPDSSPHLAMASDPDPVTGQFDPMVEFLPSQARVQIAAVTN